MESYSNTHECLFAELIHRTLSSFKQLSELDHYFTNGLLVNKYDWYGTEPHPLRPYPVPGAVQPVDQW